MNVPGGCCGDFRILNFIQLFSGQVPTAVPTGAEVLSLEEFKEVCAVSPVLIPDYAVELIYMEFCRRFQKPESTQPFIRAYVNAYRARYSSDPLIEGKPAGIARRIVKSIGLARACELIETYLEMNDYVFTQNAHDLVTFEAKLQKIMVKRYTGRSIGHVQAQQIENQDANQQALQAYRARKGKP